MSYDKPSNDIKPNDFTMNIKQQVPLIVLDKTMKDNHSTQLMNEELYYRAINR